MPKQHLKVKALPVPAHHHDGPCDCEPTIAYIRVSKVGDRQVLISPEVQLGYVKEDARRKGKRIIAVVPDIDESGRTFRKRSVDKCIAMIKAGKAHSISIWKWSRWGRNQEQSLRYLSLTRQAGGRVDSATEDFDQETAIGRYMRDLTMRTDQLLSEQIGESWQSAQEFRREAGLPHSGGPRFGYKLHEVPRQVGSGTQNVYVVDDDLRQVIVNLYEDRTAGRVGYRALAERLNAAGHRTTTGGEWTDSGLALWMDTGFAAGRIRERSPDRRKLEDGTYAPKRKGCFNAWRQGSHEAIIDAKLWRRYADMRDLDGAEPTNGLQAEIANPPARAKAASHALSALMFCNLCARRLQTRYTGSLRHHFWGCPYQAGHRGIPVSVSNEIALRLVRGWVQANAMPPTGGMAAVDAAGRAAYEQAERSDRTRSQLQDRLARWRKKLDNLFEDRNDRLIDADRFRVKRAEYEAEIAKLQEELRGLPVVLPGGRPAYEAFAGLDEIWEEATAAELNAALSEVVGMVVVSPFSEEVRAAKDWRGRGASEALTRVRVVGRWEIGEPEWERWFAARRIRMPA